MLLHCKDFKRKLNCYLALMLAGFLLSVCATVHAQIGGSDSVGTGGRHSIQGRLVFPSGLRVDIRLKIRLESSGAGDITVFSDANGQFRFQSLRPGSYTVLVDGGEYYESARESVVIESASISTRRNVAVMPISRPFTVQVYLRPKTQANEAKAGVLNAALAGVPKQAAQLYIQALDLAAKGDNEKSIELLKQAVTLHPTFGLALNELGVLYSKLGDVEKSGLAFRSAIRYSPEAYQPCLNYGIALLTQKKYDEAEIQIREALKKNPQAFAAHMYLGIVLAQLRNYPEAEAELQQAIALSGGKLGQAHYYLGGIYWKVGDFKRAADELEKYLQLEPKAANAEKVKSTIKDLRHKS